MLCWTGLRIHKARLGLLFGPREAGCWQALISQAWLSTLVAGAAAYFTGNSWLRSLAELFLMEATLLSLFLLAVAQLFWLEDRFSNVPAWCWQVFWFLGLGQILCLLLALLRPVSLGLFAFLLLCLMVSLLLRLVLWLLGRHQSQ